MLKIEKLFISPKMRSKRYFLDSVMSRRVLLLRCPYQKDLVGLGRLFLRGQVTLLLQLEEVPQGLLLLRVRGRGDGDGDGDGDCRGPCLVHGGRNLSSFLPGVLLRSVESQKKDLSCCFPQFLLLVCSMPARESIWKVGCFFFFLRTCLEQIGCCASH